MSDELNESEREQVSLLRGAANELEFVYREWAKTRHEVNKLRHELSYVKQRLSAIQQAVQGE